MAYTKTTWVNGETPINADNLNHIEGGIKDNETSINNITGTILWENPNPTADFSSQEITLTSSDYDILEIFFCSNTQSPNKTFEFRKTIKNYNITLSVIVNNVNTYRVVTFLSDNRLSVGNGYSGTDMQDRRCVPLYIIGYKTGLFGGQS